MSVGCGSMMSQPTDTVVVTDLDEIVISVDHPRQLIRKGEEGRLIIDASQLTEQPSFMGSNDPTALFRTMPSVAVNNELQAAFIVRGSGTGSNLFEINGVKVINPMHSLGIYSIYNPEYFNNYTFQPGVLPVTSLNCTGGRVNASDEWTGSRSQNPVTGNLTVGLIESRGALFAQPDKHISFNIGARGSYLSQIYPDALRLESTLLKYNFGDLNMGLKWRPDDNNEIMLSMFGATDTMTLDVDNKSNGDKDGNCGWTNAAIGLGWKHNDMDFLLSYSGLSNRFLMNEGGLALNLPSSYSEYRFKYATRLKEFNIETDWGILVASGQRNHELQNGPVYGKGTGFDGNMAVDWGHIIKDRFHINAGLRLSLYGNGDYIRLFPQPRLRLAYDLTEFIDLHLAYGRQVKFDRLIEENSAGLAANFIMIASSMFKPESYDCVEAGTNGYIPALGLDYMVDVFYKRLQHISEYCGTILNMSSSGYNPLADIQDGHGYAYGMELAVMRQFGKLRGRLSYNYGKSRVKLPRYGDRYFNSTFDRPHTLNIAVNYNPIRPLTLSLSYVHASGQPYTAVKYGYIINDNLICEYYDHNSSRLPSYNRMDFSADWRFANGKHTIGLSIYNVLACRNVLFRYTKFTQSEGIQNMESVMKLVIPAVSYTIKF